MTFNRAALSALLMSALFHARATCAATDYIPTTARPPEVQREFRGAWIATVRNTDWPSQPGLPVKQQKDELIRLLDRAVKLNLNAIVLQVRPVCDAFYESKYEPWSAYITGTMGKAPEPFYDPLAFAIEEAHKRGLELHAWFNPYRVAQLATKPVFSTNHISQTHPELVRKYGDMLWLDPGERDVQDYSLRVLMDVVRRYDIDGVHFDDYFYPYKEQDSQKRDFDFPDEASWKKYGEGRKLSRDDWRRENVNSFVERVYTSIKAEKPWVKFGIAPFGIWQTGYPPQLKVGMNAYTKLYADSRKWLENGWVDYFAPQLYWQIESEQSYPTLLKWWLAQNPRHRNIWPGLFSDQVGIKWNASEIVEQIRYTRLRCDGQTGNILYSMKSLMREPGRLAVTLGNGLYAQSALVPPSPWLENLPPAKPEMAVDSTGELHWNPMGTNTIALWVLQTKTAEEWHTRIFPGTTREASVNNSPLVIALTAIDRCGMASPVAALKSAPAAVPAH